MKLFKFYKTFTKRVVLLLLLLSSTSLIAQQGNIWHFGIKAGLDFSSDPPVSTAGGQITTDEGCASICDALGNLLFYSNGVNVWDATHSTMPNGTGLLGHPSATQSCIVTPHPGNSNQYFLFTAAAQNGTPNGINYYTIDITANGGLGDVVAGPVNLIVGGSGTERLAAVCTEDASGNPAFWVLTNTWPNNNYHAFWVDNGGVNTSPVTTTATSLGFSAYSTSGSYPGDQRVGYLKASHDGTRVAKANRWSSGPFGELMDFNESTGVFSNGRVISTNRAGYGLEFSENTNILYIGTFNRIYQYDATQTTTSALTSSANLIFTSPSSSATDDEGVGAMQMGLYGRIYVCNGYESSNGKDLDAILNPDVWGASCNYTNDFIALQPGTYGRLGLPQFPSCYTPASQPCNLAADFTYFNQNCDYHFTDATSPGSGTTIVGWLWTFGDGQSSNQQNPTHHYLQNGVYHVCLTVMGYDGDECCTSTQCYEIDVQCDPLPCQLDGGFTYENCDGSCTYDFNGFAVTNGAGQVMGWYWDFGDGTTATGQNPTHTFTSSGPHNVCLTIFVLTRDGCCEVKLCQQLSTPDCRKPEPNSSYNNPLPNAKKPNPESNPLGKEGLAAYPNPANEFVELKFLVKKAGSVRITIVDANGKTVSAPISDNYISRGVHNLNVNTSSLQPGLYIILLEANGTIESKKLKIED